MKRRPLIWHHGIKALILLGFAVYIAYLAQSDRLLLYIAPRMTAYVKLSAVLLYAAAVYQGFLALRARRGRTDACGCGHDHTPDRFKPKHALVYGLFVFPLALGFALPDTSLGSSLAAKKGMNLSSASAVKKDAPPPDAAQAGSLSSATGKEAANAGTEDAGGVARPFGEPTSEGPSSPDDLFPSDKFTAHYANLAKRLYPQPVIAVKDELFMETLTAVDLYLDRFVGKKLEITGFVYRQDEMTPKQFVIGRFSVQCCSADAAPFGVLADYERAAALAKDSWVTVTGTIGKTKFNEAEIMVLQVESIVKAEPAKTPYVYPNEGFSG